VASYAVFADINLPRRECDLINLLQKIGFLASWRLGKRSAKAANESDGHPFTQGGIGHSSASAIRRIHSASAGRMR
jgi:hypothetical protein